MDIAGGIISTANALGINPVDLATVISYETGGTFDPLKMGPTTRFGQHQGLIQFGEPQAEQFGVSFETPQQAFATQLGKNSGIYNYLKNAGVKPGMGLTQLYSAINTGGTNNLFMTDEASGGLPGTVTDKVATMGPHRKKAMELLKMNQDGQTGPLNASPLLGAINTGQPKPMQPKQGDKSGIFGFFGNAVGGGFGKVKQAITGEDEDASDRLAVALMSLSGNPTQLAPLMQMAAQDIQDRKVERKETKQRNSTISFLQKRAEQGDENAKRVLGFVDAAGAGEAMKAYIDLANGKSNVAIKTEADTKRYDSGFTVQQYSDGTVKYFQDTVELTDPDQIKIAREKAIQFDLDQKEKEITVESTANLRASKAEEVFTKLNTAKEGLFYLGSALDALYKADASGDSISGIITQYLPNITATANQLREARTRLGLNVIGSTTFGALSKDEMNLALDTDIDDGLPMPVLIEELERKQLAQSKMIESLRDASDFLNNPDLTANEALKKYNERYETLEVTNPYSQTPETRLLELYNEVTTGVSNLGPQARQHIINEVERRAKEQ